MKTILTFTVSSLLFTPVFSQTYTMATTGINSTYVGNCMVNTCSGTVYDNGGSGSNYSNSINQIYRVFCPSTAGMCMRITFTSIDFHNSNCIPGNVPCDFLNVEDGSTQNNTVLAQITYANDGQTPTYTATNSSGCLTLQFYSNGTNNAPGFAATLSCVACSAPSGAGQTSNADCVNATGVCSNVTITAVTTGPGTTSESCTGCTAGGENYSNWYTFTVQSSGTLGMTLDPSQGNDDYDFALYGPNTACGSLGSPVRCSYSAALNNTGMGNGASDVSEDVSGDGWVSTINVTAGETYYLMINHWTPPSGAYQLTWNLTNGASLNCIVLPIQMQNTQCNADANGVNIGWEVPYEENSDHFITERSADGHNYEQIAKTPGRGTNMQPLQYVVRDENPFEGNNYYRIKAVNKQGEITATEFSFCTFYKMNGAEVTDIVVYDLSGRIILSKKKENPGVQEEILKMNLQTGIYFLELKGVNGKSEIRKFAFVTE